MSHHILYVQAVMNDRLREAEAFRRHARPVARRQRTHRRNRPVARLRRAIHAVGLR